MGALDTDARAATLSHVETCAQCRERMREAEASRRHFIEHVLPRQLPALAPRRRALWWLMPPMLAAAVAAGVILIPREPEPASELGIKGSATLQLYANRGDRVMAVHDGISLQPGDRIRFVIKAAASQHLVIASIDAAGNATIYYPYNGHASVKLPDAPVHEVPGSVILDGTLGPERVFALVSRAPISVEPVLAALRGIRARGPTAIRTQLSLDVPVEEQLSVVFEKVKP
ncbi:MAG: DUF4384 domain-containing protein [Myxococcota bacterium]|nr:DUF4384 domain-containing protein [Myxococcota bacterium]